MIFFKGHKFSSLHDAMLHSDNCTILNIQLNFNLKAHGQDFAKLKNLKHLYVQGDHSIYNLEDFELPDEIGQLPELETLSFLNLPIKQFPKWITNLPKLTYLMFRGTDITKIPGFISDLKKLKKLRIENCGLATLPIELNQLTNLKELGLCDTKLTDLRPELFPQNLKRINFSGTGCYDPKDLEKLRSSMKYTIVLPMSVN